MRRDAAMLAYAILDLSYAPRVPGRSTTLQIPCDRAEFEISYFGSGQDWLRPLLSMTVWRQSRRHVHPLRAERNLRAPAACLIGPFSIEHLCCARVSARALSTVMAFANSVPARHARLPAATFSSATDRCGRPMQSLEVQPAPEADRPRVHGLIPLEELLPRTRKRSMQGI